MLKSIISSSLISVGGNFVVKILGVASTMVMARILEPQDFGLVALASVVYGLFLTLGALGSQTYILKHTDISDDIYNSTFTYRFVNLNILALVLFAVAPLVAHVFENERVIPLIYVYALCLSLHSLENVYLYSFMREMNYRPIVSFNILIKLVSVIVNIILAYWLRDYRAIIYGVFCGVVLSVIRSYSITSSRPRLFLSGVIDNWRFSRWLLLEAFFGYLRGKVDIFIVGSNFNIENVGYYELSKSNGAMPISEIANPLQTMILTVLVNQRARGAGDIAGGLEKMFISLAFIMSPIFALSYLYMDVFVVILLGKKWISTIPLFQSFLLLAYFSVFINLLSRAFIAKDMISKYVIFNAILTILLVTLLYCAVSFDIAISEFSVIRALFGLIALILTIGILRVFVTFNIISMLLSIIIFISLSGPLLYFLHYISDSYSPNRFLGILLCLTVGVPLYLISSRYLSIAISHRMPAYGCVDKLFGIAKEEVERRRRTLK